MKNDFVYFSNLLGSKGKQEIIISQGQPIDEAFFKPLFIEHRNKSLGSLIVLNVFPEDCQTKSGIIKARQQFLKALDYAINVLKVKVVLLAASTKRLFGKRLEQRINSNGLPERSGFTLKEKYHQILFTNGDNGTAVILENEIEWLLNKEGIWPQVPSKGTEWPATIIINGLGLLGANSLKYLLRKGYSANQIIVISNHSSELNAIINGRNIRVAGHIDEIGNNLNDNLVKLIINCTHHADRIITAQSIDRLQDNQKISVLDVAVPYGFPEQEYLQCCNVYRQDGGNAYIGKGLNFWFNPEICGLNHNMLYGCFAEALALSLYIKEQSNVEEAMGLDLFAINEKSKAMISRLFNRYGIGIAKSPLNFNRPMTENRKKMVMIEE